MAKSKSQKGPGKSSTSEQLLPMRGGLLWIVLVVIVLAAIVFLLGDTILEATGFGFILVLLWLAIIAWVLWRQRWSSVLKWWNIWLGAILFSFAIWGILALIQPPVVIGKAEFAKVSLGGNAGKNFIGNQGVGVAPAVRLAVLILCGIGLITPGPSFKFLRFVYRRATSTTRSATLVSARWLIKRLGQRLNKVYQRYSLRRLLAVPFAALRKKLRRSRISEPEAGEEEAGEVVALSPEIEAESEAAGGPEQAFQTTAGGKTKTAVTSELRSGTKPGVITKHQLPPVELLDKATETDLTEAGNEQRARLIEESLRSYGVEAKVVQINPGPSVTQFGIEPGWDRKYKRVVERDHQGKIRLDRDGNPIERLEEVSKTRVKVERITALANNLALALATPNIRIEAPVPGKPLVGIEVPNTTTSLVRLRGVIESTSFKKLRSKTKLAIALGKGTAGESVAADLCRMPHLLIAGATGSGKTVFINSTITCLLMYNLPQEMRLLLIDPKRVELVSFDGVPHLISPVVIEVDKAIDVLRRVNREMDTRYSKFSAMGVRNIEGYNNSQFMTEPMPYLIVIIDELAHLMMSAAEVVEPAICRLAQMSRATGIHLIVATQRPSVDVVTGLIKANFPSRISFAVASAVDSRTILDTGGAESLLGGGDMLYMPPDAIKPKRLRGCFVTDQEIERVVKFLKQQKDLLLPSMDDSVAQAFASLTTEDIKSEDPLLAAARRLGKEHSHISTSLLQRRLHIGYPRAARIMDLLEEEGLAIHKEGDKAGEMLEVDEEEREEAENEESV